MSALLADDLFAGAGGWDVAAAGLGLTARGVELLPDPRASRAANQLDTIHDDVWTFTPDGQAEGLVASPPCQTFSQAGRGAGRRALDQVMRGIRGHDWLDTDRLRRLAGEVGDERTALVLLPLHFAMQHLHYRWMAWEQVPTVLPVWKACAARLETYGWHTWAGLLHAEQFGVPQTRTRAFMLASRDHPVSPPVPTHSRFHVRDPKRLDDDVLPWVSMAEALGWEPNAVVRSNYGTRGVAANRGERPADQPAATVTSKVDRNVVTLADRKLTRATVREVDEPAQTLVFGHNVAAWQWRQQTPEGRPRFRQQSPGEPDYDWPTNRPSTTVASRDIVQNPGEVANRFNNSTQSRNDGVRITVQEAALLQGFPADFTWEGRRTKQYLQVGQAIPPPLAAVAIRAARGDQ